MNSKEAINELETVLSTNPGTKQYADIFQEHLLSPIKKDLEVLEKLKSILKVSNYDGYISFYTNGYRNNKDILEIKEWLENNI